MWWVLWLLCCVLLWYWGGTRGLSHFRDSCVRHCPPLPYVGNFQDALLGKHVFSIISKHMDKFSTERYFGFFHLQTPTVWITDCDLLRQVGVKDFDSFTDHSHPLVDENDPLYSNMLVALNGGRWRLVRSLLSPAFSSSKIRSMAPLVHHTCTHMLEHIEEEMHNAGSDVIEVNLKDLFVKLSTNLIASLAFGLQVNCFKEQDSAFERAGKRLTEFNLRFTSVFILNIMCPKLMKFLGISLIDQRAAEYFRGVVLETLRAREGQGGSRRGDMIDILLEARGGRLGGGKVWTDDELVAQALMFFVAGYETISTSLSFCLYELATHPEAQGRLLREIDQLGGTEDGDHLYESIMGLPYMDMVVSESLRLHPAVYTIDRLCTRPYYLPPPNDNTTQGYQLQPGDSICMPFRGIMRSARYFPDPDTFDPERFSEENKKNIHPYSYLPFGLGPRQCIGKRLSLMEIKCVMFQLLRRYEVRGCARTRAPCNEGLLVMGTMPQGGITVEIRRRK